VIYIDLQAIASARESGGTEATVSQNRRNSEDVYLIDIITTKDTYAMQFEQQDGVLYFQHEGRLLPWTTNEGYNREVWDLYQKQNPTLVASLRSKMRSRNINEIAFD